MFQLSDRCDILRNTVMNPNEYEKRYCAYREVYSRLGQADAAALGLENAEIVAHGIANIIDRSAPVIIPGELIVGVHFPIFEKQWGFSRQDERDMELLRACKISEEEIAKYFDIIESLPRAFHPGEHLFLKRVTPLLSEVEINSEREWAAVGRCIDSDHSVLEYEKVVKLGFGGILREIEEYEAKNGSNHLYRAMKEICRSACGLGKKYAAEAQRLLDEDDPQYAKQDLLKIVSACSGVPEHGARTLHEAIQAI